MTAKADSIKKLRDFLEQNPGTKRCALGKHLYWSSSKVDYVLPQLKGEMYNGLVLKSSVTVKPGTEVNTAEKYITKEYNNEVSDYHRRIIESAFNAGRDSVSTL